MRKEITYNNRKVSSVKIESIKFDREEKCVDLSTPSHKNFILSNLLLSHNSKVRIGKTKTKDSKVMSWKEDGSIITSECLGNYKDGEIINTISVNPMTGEIIKTKSEVIQELDNKEFYTLELEDGRKVSCSMDHKFYVKVSNTIKVLPLREIKEGDEIICLK